MADPRDLQADPTAIGGVVVPPLARLPDPATLFVKRSMRLRAHAEASGLKPFPPFLAGLADASAPDAAPLDGKALVPVGSCTRALRPIRWNVVRVKRTLCGSTKGSTPVGVESRNGTLRAETCDARGRDAKMLQGREDGAVDAVADDVGSLGLDLPMRGACESILKGC